MQPFSRNYLRMCSKTQEELEHRKEGVDTAKRQRDCLAGWQRRSQDDSCAPEAQGTQSGLGPWDLRDRHAENCHHNIPTASGLPFEPENRMAKSAYPGFLLVFGLCWL